MAINIALLGTGRIADNALAPAIGLANGAQLWSVLSRDKSRAAALRNAMARRPATTLSQIWMSY